MAWVLRTPQHKFFCATEDWSELIECVRLKSGNRNAIETLVKYTDGSHIRHVYGSLYVAFDSYDKQVAIKSCSNSTPEKEFRPWMQMEEDEYALCPTEDDHFLAKFEFTGGWHAEWVEDLSTLDGESVATEESH